MDRQDIPENIKCLYYDIETTSIDGTFPDPQILGNKITQICCVITDMKKIKRKVALVLGEIENNWDYDVYSY